MKIGINVLVLFIVAAFAGYSVKAQQCVVADPTGTPLNIRKSPNGRIVGKLSNGSVVLIEHYTVDAITGKGWAKIGVNRKRKYVVLGYVLDAYLNCD